MNKQQLLADLQGKDFCDRILGTREVQLSPDDLKVTNNITVYEIHFVDIQGKAAVCRKVNAYVYNEGEATEKAFYMQREPETQIKAKEVTP